MWVVIFKIFVPIQVQSLIKSDALTKFLDKIYKSYDVSSKNLI